MMYSASSKSTTPAVATTKTFLLLVVVLCCAPQLCSGLEMAHIVDDATYYLKEALIAAIEVLAPSNHQKGCRTIGDKTKGGGFDAHLSGTFIHRMMPTTTDPNSPDYGVVKEYMFRLNGTAHEIAHRENFPPHTKWEHDRQTIDRISCTSFYVSGWLGEPKGSVFVYDYNTDSFKEYNRNHDVFLWTRMDTNADTTADEF